MNSLEGPLLFPISPGRGELPPLLDALPELAHDRQALEPGAPAGQVLGGDARRADRGDLTGGHQYLTLGSTSAAILRG